MVAVPRVVVAGLGPAGADLVTSGTLAAIERIERRFVRTRRHPAVTVVSDARSFDDLYESADTLDEVYRGIVEELVAAASEAGEVLYLVPGSPVVAERSVELLGSDDRVEVELLAALSFADLAWARLGIDPVAAGVRLVDGQRFAVDAAGERGPFLVAQCDSPDVLSEIKLTLDAGAEPCLPPDATVTVLRRLGLPDEVVEPVRWVELDRVETDHLTSLWIPALAAPVAREVARFAELVAVLRRECPWDREQTHESLTRHLVEETYEVLDAIDAVAENRPGAYELLEEELGDLLLQVVFHTTLAEEAGQFTLADVASGIHDKLRARHPHVFGDVEVAGPEDVARNWERIKQAEKGRESIFEGIPTHLPALLYALKVQKKAAALGERGVALPELPALASTDVGERLFALVDEARRHGIDPEAALRAAANRYRRAVQEREAAGPPPG